jgi:hypothetical protein
MNKKKFSVYYIMGLQDILGIFKMFNGKSM